MPLSEDQKRQFLIEKGYDPEKFELEEVPINAEEDTITPPVISNPALPQLSAAQSFWQGAKDSLVPSAAALGTSAAVLKGLSTIAPHPLIKIPGSIASGLLASYAASKLQEEALRRAMSPENYAARQAKQQAAASQHGVATTLGSALPSFAAFGPGGLGRVVSGASKLPKQVVGANALSEGEKVALTGAAINTGLGGGTETIREVVSGEEISPTKIALASGIGTLQNQPWGIGKKMFPSLTPPPESVTPIKPKAKAPVDQPKVIDPNTLPEKAVKVPFKADSETIVEQQDQEVKPSLSTDVSDPVIKAGEPANRPQTEEDYTPDPGEKFYQEDNKPTVKQDKWTEDQKMPGTNFAYKIQRWANTPEGSQVRPASQMVGTLKNKFGQEWELFKDLGLEKHLTEEIPTHKIGGGYIDNWIRKNGPRVEVKGLQATKPISDKELEYNRITHEWYDNLNENNRTFLDQVWYKNVNGDEQAFVDELKKGGWQNIDISQAKRYRQLGEELRYENHNTGDHNESATARYTMVNPKSLDQMEGAVDLLVRIPLKSKSDPKIEFKSAQARRDFEGVKYSSGHYPTEGKNLLAHVRGYMETLPDSGKKVFRIFEVQSDWAQQLREENAIDTQHGVKGSKNILNDPLLKHYERLALKTAIDHAKKQGADYIAIDDAETAMITEGHDRQFAQDTPYANEATAEDLPDLIPQYNGMKLHYDKSLPKIAEELTGEKGINVDFGEHQNTTQQTHTDEITRQPVRIPRSDLIFKNPDGTPKTRSTARLYSLNKAKEIIDEKGGISLTGNKLYQEADKAKPLTKEQYETKDKPLAAKRGATLERVPEIISERTGKPVRGEALPTERKALITDIATSDTPVHEVSHILLKDLKTSKLQADRDFYNRGIKLAGSEESLVENAGLRYEEINNKPLRAWFQDLGSNIKRLTRIAESSKDYERILARRLRDDRPYSESPEYIKTDAEGSNQSPQTSKALYSEDEGEGNKNSAAETESDEGPGLIKRLSQKLDPVVDKLKQSGPLGAKAGEAAEKAFRDMTRFEGKITNALVGETKNISRANNESVAAYIYKKRGYDIPEEISVKDISPEDQAIIDDKVYPVLKEVVELQKTLPYQRRIKPDPNYRGPVMVDPKVIEQLNKLPENSSVKKSLVEDFINHQIKYNKDIKGSRKKAVEIYNDYIRGIGSTHGTTEFNALRKAEGYGLPFSWMDKDINRLFRRYGDRVAKDLAYFKHIESNKDVASLFGAGGKKIEGQPALLNENLATVKRLLLGDFTRKDAITDTAESFTRALILGPLTGIKNVVGSINKSLIYTPVKDLPKIAQSLTYLNKGLKDSLEMGVNRHNTLEIFTRNDEGISTIADNFRRVANTIRTVTGANAIEQISRARTQAQGDLMARAAVGRYAKNGDIEAAKFLNKFKDKEMSLESFRKGDVSEETYKRIAANFVERIEGTYDARGLPAGLLEPTSIFYYIGALSKWSVETGNRVKTDVLKPLAEGDWGPFLRYTLGSIAVAGPLISAINELFSGGKKSQYPNFKELEEKGELDDFAHKVVELGSLAGFLGIYGDLVKASMDLGKGMKPKGYNLPSLDITTDAITEINNAQKALQEGQDIFKVGLQLVSNLILDNFQAARLVHNQFKPEDVDRANKFRDKRVYDRLSNKKLPAQSGDKPDRYGAEDINRFKEAKSFNEAVDILQKEILPRIKNDPNRKDILEGLKRNSYQTMPSDPIERKKYYDYLVKTQGKKAADDLMKDKLLQDLINQSKSRVVPKY